MLKRRKWTGLLEALKTYGLPPKFIDIVESLYKHAETKVMINGVLSEAFRIIRGVRQGDAMSCLLFNIAIEPLATLLRTTGFHGYKTPTMTRSAIVSMFADDTTLFLRKGDSFYAMQLLLDLWCIASGAKFNINKTEIIPIGTKTHRDSVVTTRRLHPGHHAVPDNIRIASDGMAVRILGAG